MSLGFAKFTGRRMAGRGETPATSRGRPLWSAGPTDHKSPAGVGAGLDRGMMLAVIRDLFGCRLRIAVIFGALIVTVACGASSDGSLVGPSVSAPTNAASLLSQNGCAATYQCPLTDANGRPDPSTPTFDTLTL